MNVEQLVPMLDSAADASPWLAGMGIRDTEAAHAKIVAIAGTGITLDLLSEICRQLALHLPTVGDADLALAALSRFVASSRNPLSLGSLIEEDDEALPTLLRLFSASPTLGDLLVADPASYDLLRLTEGQAADRVQLTREICDEISHLTHTRDAVASLRSFKDRETLRIAYGDIVQRQPSEIVARQLSYLAAAICEAALRFAQTMLMAKYGRPRHGTGESTRFVWIGLERFGANELDYEPRLKSLFIYEADGRTDGSASIDNHEFFEKLVAKLVSLLAPDPAHDVIYGVDVDKTPGQQAGRSAASLDWVVTHFDTRGRTWERQLLINARPVGGDLSLGFEFIDALEPWVFRRYLSRADVTGIKALKRRIVRRTDRRSSAVLDVDGGVLDVEFIVQFLQLINGGDEREVRVGGTIPALQQLENTNCITSDESQTLQSNYSWLRRVEHRLEIMRGPTIQALPREDEWVRKFALQCGFDFQPSDDLSEAFRADYDRRLHQNQEIINRLLDETFSGDSEEDCHESDLVLDPDPSPELITEVLEGYGFRDPLDAFHSLSELAVERIPFLSTRRCRHFLSRIAKPLLCSIRDTPSPDATLANLCRISGSIGGKGVLWELFHAHPPSMDLYVRLCSSSPYLSSILTRYPGMIDELLDSLMLAELPTLGDLQETLRNLCSKVENIEPVLHSFKNTQHLNVGVRELLGSVHVRNSTATLADVAESCLHQIASDQQKKLVEKYGRPSLDDGRTCELVILAMGKFGGREPNYHSDVDVTFVFERAGSTRHPPTIRNRETTTNHHFFGELGQRIFKAVGEHGELGRLYDIDPTLRPIASSSLVAVSLDEFRDFYLGKTHAFTELRPLCQARAVFGSERLRAAMSSTLHEILINAKVTHLDGDSVRRARLRLQENAGPRNLKRGPGGTMDIEFIAHLLQIRHASESPPILSPNTLASLQLLQEHGYLDGEESRLLIESYEFLRSVEARLRLINATARHDLPREPDELAKLTYLLRYEGPQKLEAKCAQLTRQNRQLFEELVN